MNKEIIIDGCNVAKCCCFEDNRCLWTKKYYATCKVTPPCEAIKNCYFKQLQRLKKENEELEKDIETRIMCISCQRELENCNLQVENEKYKQALEEIRDVLCEGITFYNGYWNNPETFTQSDKIILKINEVLNENI